MNELLNQTLDVDTFKMCWNAMCKIKEQTFAFLKALAELQKQYGFKIHIISNTNIWHHEYIKSQFEGHTVPEISFTHSYEEGTLEPHIENADEDTYDLRMLQNDDIIKELYQLCQDPKKSSEEQPQMRRRSVSFR